MNDTYDSPWKEILELYFFEFLEFFFPAIHRQVDRSKGYVCLDKELEPVVRDAAAGSNLADKLIRVYRLDGVEQDVLVHVEVQSDSETAFPLRMFRYSYRIFDRYHRPVVSLAVLGDDKPDWRPQAYGWKLWGCQMNLRFPIVKLWDYNDRWQDLQRSRNPFSTLVMAHLKTRATRNDPESRLRWKLRLVRRLYEMGYGRRDVLEIFRLLDWLLRLPPELETAFHHELGQYEARKGMRYITQIERSGIQKGATSVLQRQMNRRFGGIPQHLLERLENADQEQLERWADRVLEARSAEEVFGE
jgi:hypothetical protein